MNKILFILFTLFVFACKGQQQVREVIYVQQDVLQSISSEEIGTYVDPDTWIKYRSIYTKETLENASKFYFDRLRRESTRAHRVVLFYNDREQTPSSDELGLKSSRLNPALIGGIETVKGPCYILNYIPDDGLSRGEKIILTRHADDSSLKELIQEMESKE